jgi:uncharacterized protein (TIGR03435 family)
VTFAKKAALATGGIAALTVPITVGMLNATVSQAYPPESQSPQKEVIPKFEVASIKPCKANQVTPGRRKGGSDFSSPGRLKLGCQTLESMIQWAYLGFADAKALPASEIAGLPPRPPISVRLLFQSIKGGPAWVSFDRYSIEAKAEGTPDNAMMRGPMMQALLEDRFKLKIHRETKKVPLFELRVAKGGPRLQAARKGTCIAVDFEHPAVPGRPSRPGCGLFGPSAGDGVDTYGQTMAGLCMQLSASLDRDVIDKTGIAGTFDIHLDLSMRDLFPGFHGDSVGGSDDPAAVQLTPTDPTGSIFAALRKLGLKLEPGKGAAELLVIDHVERPSEN